MQEIHLLTEHGSNGVEVILAICAGIMLLSVAAAFFRLAFYERF